MRAALLIVPHGASHTPEVAPCVARRAPGGTRSGGAADRNAGGRPAARSCRPVSACRGAWPWFSSFHSEVHRGFVFFPLGAGVLVGGVVGLFGWRVSVRLVARVVAGRVGAGGYRLVLLVGGGVGVRGGLGAAAAGAVGRRAAVVVGLAVCAGVGGFGAHRGVGPVAGPWPGAGGGRWRGARRRVGTAGAGLCLGVGVGEHCRGVGRRLVVPGFAARV